VLLAVRINVNDENERNEVIALVLKLMNRRFEITVGKLFTVDHSLLFSAGLPEVFQISNYCNCVF
jgi:hypothetical protein